MLAGSADIDAFLQKLVVLVAKHLRAEVCSIYLYDEKQNELVLRATHGLNPDGVGRLRIPLGQGLVGWALQNGKTSNETHASRHPNFLHFEYFEGRLDELLDAFLAVPVWRGSERIGVIASQRQTSNPFLLMDERALGAIASHNTAIRSSFTRDRERPTGRAKEGSAASRRWW